MTTVTAAVSRPVSSNAMPSVVASASALPPPSSSTVVTTVSGAIMSMAVAVQAENLSMPVCSEMGASQPPNSMQGMEETITPVPEDFVGGVTSAAVSTIATPSGAMIYGQSGCGTTPMLAYAQSSITVSMLGDALQTVNARMQGSDPVTRANDSVVQSLLQWIQQLETLNAENVMLWQRIADLETQAYQAQSLTAVYQKQEARGSDRAVVTGAQNQAAKCKRNWSKKLKKSHLASFVSPYSQSSAESSDSDSDGDTEALLHTSSQSR